MSGSAQAHITGNYGSRALRKASTAAITSAGTISKWLLESIQPHELLFRLAEEAGVVLLPGKGFGTRHPSGRVSLANLNEEDYVKIGRCVRKLRDEYLEPVAGAAHRRDRAAGRDRHADRAHLACRAYVQQAFVTSERELPRLSAGAHSGVFGEGVWRADAGAAGGLRFSSPARSQLGQRQLVKAF